MVTHAIPTLGGEDWTDGLGNILQAGYHKLGLNVLRSFMLAFSMRKLIRTQTPGVMADWDHKLIAMHTWGQGNFVISYKFRQRS